jgi:hypothetical protein
MKNDREVMQALLDGKKIYLEPYYGCLYLNKEGFLVDDNGNPSAYIRGREYKIYEPPKKKYIMYRHWYLDNAKELNKYDSIKIWDEIHLVNVTFIETEIIKEIEI